MASKKRLAVIIPALNLMPHAQIELVSNQLTSIDQLIVVRNGLRSHGAISITFPRAYKRTQIINIPKILSPGNARNIGVSHAQGASIFAFTDADDLVNPDWLSTLVRPLLDGVADVVGGALFVQSRRKDTIVLPGTDFWYKQALIGNNLALTSQAWFRLGGFNPQFRYCEDTDIAWRASNAGLRVHVVPDAVVQVTPRSTIGEAIQRFNWGRASVELIAAHGLSVTHLPNLLQLIAHKREIHYCGNPTLSAMSQWVGQCFGRCELRF